MNAEAAGHIGAGGGGHEAMNNAVAGGVELLAAAEAAAAAQAGQQGTAAGGQQEDPPNNNDETEMSTEENANEADANANTNTTSSSSGTGAGTTATSRYSLRKRSRQPLQSLLLAGDGNTTAVTATTIATAKNISTTATIGFTYADTMTDRKFERLLARHEERGAHERSEKRLRLERGYGDDDYPYQPPAEGCPAFDALPKEAIQLVFEMLPSARSVFNLAYQSKYMLSFVEKRADIVIRAAMHGCAGNEILNPARPILTNIIKLVRRRAIHVPSALRLLKLANSKRCERGRDCFEYDLKQNLASAEGVSGTHYRAYGLSLCKTCTKDCSRRRPWQWNRWNSWARTDDRIVVHSWSKIINPARALDVVLVGPTSRAADDDDDDDEEEDFERIGPIFTAMHAERICAAHPSDEEKQKEALKAAIEGVIGEEGSDAWEDFEKASLDLVELYETAESDLRAWVANRNRKKREEKNSRREDSLAKKKEKLEPIVAALGKTLADVPLKEYALDYSWSSHSVAEPIRFRYFFMRDTMSHLISAPSSASTKRIKSTISAVRRKLGILHANGDDFLSFSFLTTLIEGSQGRIKKALEKIKDRVQGRYGISYYSSGKQWLIDSQQYAGAKHDLNNTNDVFFDLLEKKEYLSALIHILIARNDLVTVVGQTLVSSSSSDQYNHRNLARTVWKKQHSERLEDSGGGYSLETFTEALEECREEFRVMKTNAKDYLELEPVKEFSALGTSWGGLTGKSATENCWTPKTTVVNCRYPSWNNSTPANLRNVKPYDLLAQRDFTRLLAMHQLYRRRGSAYLNHYYPNNN